MLHSPPYKMFLVSCQCLAVTSTRHDKAADKNEWIKMSSLSGLPKVHCWLMTISCTYPAYVTSSKSHHTHLWFASFLVFFPHKLACTNARSYSSVLPMCSRFWIVSWWKNKRYVDRVDRWKYTNNIHLLTKWNPDILIFSNNIIT